MKTDRKRVAIYARKSVKKSETTVSIDTQIEECTRAIQVRYPDAIITPFADVGSGKNTNRPKFLELLQAIDEGKFDAVCVWKLDRFSRSVADFFTIYERLKKVDCQFIALMDGFDTNTTQSTMMMTILAGFAQMERENISDRVSSAFANIEQSDGRWLYGKAPFGFRNGKDEHDLPTLIPCDSEQEIVKDLFRKYIEDNDVSLFSLTGYLQQKYGIRKSASAIRRILSSEKYVIPDRVLYSYFQSLGCTLLNPITDWIEQKGRKNGCVAVGIKTHEADGKQHVLPPSEWVIHLSNHSGFISSEDYIAVQRRLTKNNEKRKAGGPRRHAWQELSGPYVRCSRCGSSVRVIISHGKERNISCSRKYLYQGGSCGLCFYQVSSDLVRENVGKDIQNVLQMLEKALSSTTDAMVKAQKQVEELTEEKDALLSALKATRNDKTQKTLLKEMDRIEQTQEQILANMMVNVYVSPLDTLLRRLSNHNASDSDDADDNISSDSRTINYSELTTEEKASLIELLVDRIYIYKDGSVAVIYQQIPALPAEYLEKNQQLKKDIESQFIQ